MQEELLEFDDPYEEEESQVSRYQPHKSSTKSRTPVLDNFCTDVTKLADEGKLSPISSRQSDLDKISVYLTRKKSNNPIIISDSHSYRVSLIENLTVRIISRKITRFLFNKRIVKLNIESLIRGAEKPGQLEERIQAITYELEKDRDVILFLEEFYYLFGNRNNKPLSIIADTLMASIEKNNIQIITCTSSYELESFFRSNPKAKNYYQTLNIGLPIADELVKILYNIKFQYEEFHNVIFSDEAIEKCAILSEKYIKDALPPDNAINMFDEIGATVRILNLHVPTHIEELEKQIEELKEIKNQAVKNQQYEKAADTRDKESKLTRQLEFAKVQWEEEEKLKPYYVNEDDVFHVFHLKTGYSIEFLKNEKDGGNEFSEEILVENEYLKERAKEYDFENKTSIKINDIPDYLKTSLQQYILFFKDYVEKVKGKEIFFEVSKIEEGLRIDINPEEIENFEEFNTWFNEYLDFIRKKSESFTVNFEKDVEDREAEIVMAELKNQVRHLESQLELIQLQVKNLTNGEEIFNRLALDVSEQQKYLIEQGYSNLEAFRSKLKEHLGRGKVKPVLDDMFKYISKSPTNNQQDLDEIILFNSRLSELDFKLSAGIISYDEEKIEKQKIYKAILGFINKL